MNLPQKYDTAWRKNPAHDPYRMFAAQLLVTQLEYARVYADREHLGPATMRMVLLRGERTSQALLTNLSMWRSVCEAEAATYDDWLDVDNPDGAPRLLELLGYEPHVIQRYVAVVEEALDSL